MATLKYANPTSGPSAGGIGWIDWGDTFTLSPGQTITGITLTLLDDAIMTFDIKNTTISGTGFTFYSNSTPVYLNAPFGTLGYTNINGNVALQPFNDYIVGSNVSVITLENIQVIDDNTLLPVTNFTMVAAEVETSNGGGDINKESQVYTTYSSIWTHLAWFGNITSPNTSGLNTNTYTMISNNDDNGSPVVVSDNPFKIEFTIVSETGLQCVALGVAISSVRIRCYITERINPSDQFVLSISGTPSGSVTTTGSSTGLQQEIVSIDGYVGSSYTINETMSAGSVSSLLQYEQKVVWTQLTPGGTPPPTPGALGDSVTLALGDVFIVDIINSPRIPSRGINLFNFQE